MTMVSAFCHMKGGNFHGCRTAETEKPIFEKSDILF